MRSAPLLSCAFLLVAFDSLADPPPQASVRLSYTCELIATRCPPEDYLHSEVARRLGYDPFTADGTTLLTVTLTPRGRECQVTAQMRDAEGNLLQDDSFHDPDCRPLVMVAGSGAASALTPMPSPKPSATSAASPPPSSAIPSPTPSTPTPVAKPAPVLTPPPPSVQSHAAVAPARLSVARIPIGVRVGAGSVVSFGITPQPSFGGSAFVAVHLGDWVSLGVEGRFNDALSAVFDGTPTGALFAALTVLPCVHRDHFFVCAAFDFGALQGTSSSDVKKVETIKTDVQTFGLRSGVEWSLSGRLGWRAFVQGSVIPAESKFRIDTNEVWNTPPMYVMLGASLTWALY